MANVLNPNSPLTNIERVILRSRVRLHKNVTACIYSVTNDAKTTVSQLTNSDLQQVAILCGLDRPSAFECAVYVSTKDQGKSGREAILAANVAAVSTGGNRAQLASSINQLSIEDDENSEAETENPTDQASLDDVEGGIEGAFDSGNAALKAEAKKTVDSLRQQFASGDFSGYTNALQELAEKALKPTTTNIITKLVHTVDTSKIKGEIANSLGKKSMLELGVSSTLKVKNSATRLEVYDAKDAPMIDNGYVWPPETSNIFAAIARGGSVFLWGPAGTGKTSLAKQLAARLGRSYVRVSCHDQTEAATLVGMTVPDGAGGVKWQDGQLTAAIRKPGTVVLVDEPSVARPGALFVLQALLDDERAIHIEETGEVVHAAPDVIILLSDNTNGTGDSSGAYEATRRLNRATLDRPSLTVRLDYLPTTKERVLLQKRTGCDEDLARALVSFAGRTREYTQNGELSHGVGLRRLMSLAEQIVDGASPDAAYNLAVAGTAPHDDQERLRQLWTLDFPQSAFINNIDLKAA